MHVLLALLQAQESWHRTGVVDLLEGQMKASTEVLLSDSMPKVLMQDASSNPDALCLSIHPMWVPEGMLKKAYLNLAEATKCVKVGRRREGW